MLISDTMPETFQPAFAMKGFRVRYTPHEGIQLTGLIGQQRIFFDMGPGLARVLDGNIVINEIVPTFRDLSTRVSLGGSFVSNYQPDDDPIFVLPENGFIYKPGHALLINTS